MKALRLDLLCALLDQVRREPDAWPSPATLDHRDVPSYPTILHHIAFALGENLVDLDGHRLSMTRRGHRVHELLCDPARQQAMERVVGERTPDELSYWLEEHAGTRR